jgi:hypothetical protein
VAEAITLPIIIYNIPPRSVIDMSVETMAALAKRFLQHCRGQGRDREPRPRAGTADGLWQGFRAIVR